MSIVNKILKEALLKEESNSQMYFCLNSSSKINTSNPLENEYVRENLTFLLLSINNGKSLILSGSGHDYCTVGETIYLFDDGNETTKLPKAYTSKIIDGRRQTIRKSQWQGLSAKVIAIANSPEEIKSFPVGKYQLYVMK